MKFQIMERQKFWLDTEFIEDGKTIDLISIGIVCEDGREYYALNIDCELSKASDWVKENVIAKLPPKYCDLSDPSISPRLKSESQLWKSKKQIAGEVVEFMGGVGLGDPLPHVGWNKLKHKLFDRSPEWIYSIVENIPLFRPRTYFKTWYKLKDNTPKPEIWAYYADYDWVVFCQLFGTMMDLPKGFPMYCRDIKQECDRLGNPQLPTQGDGVHNALEDARWNRIAWEFLEQMQRSS